MSLQPGVGIGPYEVTGAIGAGGMGEVYRARDTRLGRDVALKVLPALFTDDPERLARFEREARTLAALNHPNIAQIYGVERFSLTEGVVPPSGRGSDLRQVSGRSDPLVTPAIVMELVEGEDLARRIRQGPLSPDEALDVARQVADALDAAHGKGIVHRDLKPANIKVTPDGVVKVLDFGLAKAAAGPDAQAAGADLADSPTLTARATQVGVILGTAAYMAPEQAKGRPVDRRVDIWAFGAVLFEMLAGRRAFDGDDVSEVLASVIKGEVRWEALPAATPPIVRHVLERCLEKDPRRRLRDIGDALFDLEAGSQLGPDAGPPVPAGSDRLPWLIAAGAAVVALVAVATVWTAGGADAPREPIHLRVPLDPADHLSDDPSIAISPDGRVVIFRGRIDGQTRLLLKDLASSEVTIVDGSEDASLPAFSPDGTAVVFGARGTIWKAALSGGDPIPLVQNQSPYGICWSSDGWVVFNTTWATGLTRVPEGGGEVVTVTTAEPGTSHLWPICLPDGDHVLFTRWSGESREAITVNAVTLSTGEVNEIVRDATYPRFYPSGILTSLRGTTLMAARFDPRRLELEHEPVVVLSRVSLGLGTLGGSYDLSATGTLVYVPASDLSDPKGIWVDLDGNEVGQVEPQLSQWAYPAISPDGSKLLVTEQGPAFQTWLIDLEGGPRSQLTRAYDNGEAIWTPDGDIVFFSNRHGRYELLRQAADGTGEPEVLVGGGFPDPQDVSADGRHLLFSNLAADTNRDILLLDLDAPGEPTPFVSSPAGERAAKFSPDGRYVAYQSTISGRDEVYVTPFPGPGASWQISNGGGFAPIWSPDGRFLYFHDGADGVMRVATTPGGTFRAGRPEKLFERSFHHEGISRDFDTSPDGTKLLFIEAPDLTPFQQLNIVLNWSAVLEQALAAAR